MVDQVSLSSAADDHAAVFELHSRDEDGRQVLLKPPDESSVSLQNSLTGCGPLRQQVNSASSQLTSDTGAITQC